MDATQQAVADLLQQAAGKTKTKGQGIVVNRDDRIPEAVAGLKADAINHENRKHCRMVRLRQLQNPRIGRPKG